MSQSASQSASQVVGLSASERVSLSVSHSASQLASTSVSWAENERVSQLRQSLIDIFLLLDGLSVLLLFLQETINCHPLMPLDLMLLLLVEEILG